MSDDKIKNISEVKNKRYSLGYEDVNRIFIILSTLKRIQIIKV